MATAKPIRMPSSIERDLFESHKLLFPAKLSFDLSTGIGALSSKTACGADCSTFASGAWLVNHCGTAPIPAAQIRVRPIEVLRSGLSVLLPLPACIMLGVSVDYLRKAGKGIRHIRERG